MVLTTRDGQHKGMRNHKLSARYGGTNMKKAQHHIVLILHQGLIRNHWDFKIQSEGRLGHSIDEASNYERCVVVV